MDFLGFPSINALLSVQKELSMVDHVKGEGRVAVRHRWGSDSSCVRKRRRKMAASMEEVGGKKSRCLHEGKVLPLSWLVLNSHV